MAGFDATDSIKFSMLVAFANMSMTLVTIAFVDRCGRRPLLLCSLLGVIGSLSVLALSFIWKEHGGGDLAVWLTVAALVLYIITFAPGMGPIPWTVNSEIYPTHCRAAGNGASSAGNWISNLLISLAFLPVTKLITPAGTFFLLASISVGGFFFFFFKLPETKGKSLEEIQAEFK